jgi:OFA family oxalate/formate antiporter-like MFS transporter
LTGSVHALAQRTPFFYGWVVLGCATCSSFARQAGAVATLSVFVVPMTLEFGWSRAEISGAVSLGGVMAAVASPAIGRMVDRIGARAVLVSSAVLIAATALALSATSSLLWFYVFFSLARMLFASPFDIAITAAAANWFVRRRARAMGIIALAGAASLAVMPLLAQFAINVGGWRSGWLAVAIAVFVVGALPNLLFMVRRPEDIGLLPDGGSTQEPQSHYRSNPTAGQGLKSPSNKARIEPAVREASFTLAQARRTPAMWLLMAFTALIFSVQAGVSLHQAPVMIARGISPTAAASVISVFAVVAAVSGFAFGLIASRVPVHYCLAAAALEVAAGALLTASVDTVADGYLSAAVFGVGIGALMSLVPIAFADYFGRAHYGAIRGMALPAQVVGQATGPLTAGVLFDQSGSYESAMAVFAAVAIIAAVLVLAAPPPRQSRVT